MAQKVEETKEYEKPKKTETWSGIPLKEVYTPEDIKGIDYQKDIGEAGEYPYTRGIYRDLYRYKVPTRRIISGFGSPSDTNKRLKYYIAQGFTGLDVYPDIISCFPLDADHPRAWGEIGVQGVSCCNLRDMEEICEGIPLDKVTAFWRIPPTYLALMCEKQEIPLAALRGTVGGGAAGHDGPWIQSAPGAIKDFPLRQKMGVDNVEYCTRHMPSLYCTYYDSYNIREWGLSATQELGWLFSKCTESNDLIVKRGIGIDEFGPRITFFMTSHRDFFEEIAKFRAARRMWARIMKERYGAKDPRSLRFRFAVETAGSSLVPEQPLNNVVRIAYECMSAMLGGVQSMSPPSYLEPVCLPTEESAMLQVRTQQILQLETGVSNVTDPCGGSYYIEWLTNQIEEEARKIMKEVEEIGGARAAVLNGWVDRMVNKALIQRQREMESGERVYVGKNCYTIEEKPETPGGYFKNPTHDFEAGRGKEIIARLKTLKETRDNNKVKETLYELWKKAKASKEGASINLLPFSMEAEKVYATRGEVNGVIREAWGYRYDPFGEVEMPFKFD